MAKKKFTIISNINIEHVVEAETEKEALDIHANHIELPKEYVSNSWDLVQVFKEDEECDTCGRQDCMCLPL